MAIPREESLRRAQAAMVELKEAVREVLAGAPPGGLSNAEIGRSLGIYDGHKGHEGHISRTLLATLEAEGIAIQDAKTKAWCLRAKPLGVLQNPE